MAWWQKTIIVVALYGLIVGAFWIMCRNAPMDPNDSETRDDEK